MLRCPAISTPISIPILMAISYNGQQYHGFQRQRRDHQLGVQNCLEETLSLFFNQPIEIKSASRTDRGVHANEMLIRFQAPLKLLEKIDSQSGHLLQKLPAILNRRLPQDIRILYAEKAAIREALLKPSQLKKGLGKEKIQTLAKTPFHPRHAAALRLYRYRLADSSSLASYGYLLNACHTLPYRLQEHDSYEKFGLRSYFQHFLGTHDFTSFSAAKDSSSSKLRHIHAIDMVFAYPYIYVDIYANAFLQSMVRSIIGNTLELYRKNKNPKTISAMLTAKNPNIAKARAPSAPLSLAKVFYCPAYDRPPKFSWRLSN